MEEVDLPHRQFSFVRSRTEGGMKAYLGEFDCKVDQKDLFRAGPLLGGCDGLVLCGEKRGWLSWFLE